MSELDELRDRVAMLESENRQLKAPDGSKRSAWLRPTIAAILITVGVILAPVSVIGAWARLELVDTDRFVATLGPLAQDPAVQAMVASGFHPGRRPPWACSKGPLRWASRR